MAVVDSNLLFTAIYVGAYGSEGDSTIFQNSLLGKKLYASTLNLSPRRYLQNTNENP